MTKKSDLKPKEWNDLISLVGIGVSYKYSKRDMYSPGDMIGGLREFLSARDFLVKAADKYSQCELVKEVIAELLHAGNSPQNFLSDNIYDAKNLEPIITRGSLILTQHATEEEARAMRALTYELAFEIASAAGDGVFGIGTRISQAEKEFLQELKRLLISD